MLLFITAAILNLGRVVYSSYGAGMNWMESDIFNGFFVILKECIKPSILKQSKTRNIKVLLHTQSTSSLYMASFPKCSVAQPHHSQSPHQSWTSIAISTWRVCSALVCLPKELPSNGVLSCGFVWILVLFCFVFNFNYSKSETTLYYPFVWSGNLFSTLSYKYLTSTSLAIIPTSSTEV